MLVAKLNIISRPTSFYAFFIHYFLLITFLIKKTKRSVVVEEGHHQHRPRKMAQRKAKAGVVHHQLRDPKLKRKRRTMAVAVVVEVPNLNVVDLNPRRYQRQVRRHEVKEVGPAVQ